MRTEMKNPFRWHEYVRQIPNKNPNGKKNSDMNSKIKKKDRKTNMIRMEVIGCGM